MMRDQKARPFRRKLRQRRWLSGDSQCRRWLGAAGAAWAGARAASRGRGRAARRSGRLVGGSAFEPHRRLAPRGQRSGAIALMDIAIKDQHILRFALSQQGMGGDGQVVKHAEAGTKIVVGVMGAAGKACRDAVFLGKSDTSPVV